jgi:hypothetical protein
MKLTHISTSVDKQNNSGTVGGGGLCSVLLEVIKGEHIIDPGIVHKRVHSSVVELS